MSAKVGVARIVAFLPYLFIFVLTFLMMYLVPIKHVSPKILVADSVEEFDEENYPIHILHLTDIHASDNFPEAVERLKTVLTYSKDYIRPNFVILTGDLADDYVGAEEPTRSKQIEGHWKLYSGAIEESGISMDNVLEVFGNHDLWATLRYNKSEAYSWKYAKSIPENADFFSYSKTKNGVRFVAFNSQEFPTGYGALQYINAFTREMLDSFESEISKESDANVTFVAIHNIIDLIHPFNTKSSSGKTFSDMLVENNVPALTNGHNHPNYIETLHVGRKYMELTGTALKTTDGFQIISYDNNHLNYHFYRLSDWVDDKVFIITYPTPTNMSITNSKLDSFKIRVVLFSNNTNEQFTYSINDGEKTGTLSYYATLGPGSTLYQSSTLSFTSGVHKLTVNGTEVEFAVNVETGPFTEPKKRDITWYCGIIASVLLYILNTVWAIGMFVKLPLISNLAKSLSGSGEISWLLTLLLGPLVVGNCLQVHPVWVRIIAAIFIYWLLVGLPILIYDTEGGLSMLFFYGYCADGKFRYDSFSQLVGAVYLTVVTPVFVDVLYVLSLPLTLLNIVDCAIVVGLIAFLIWFWGYYGRGFAYPSIYALSVCFTFIPLICLAIVLYIIYTKYIRKRTHSIDDKDAVGDDNTADDDALGV